MKILGYPLKTPYREGKNIVIYDAQVSKRFSVITHSFGYTFLTISFAGLMLFLLPIISSEFSYRLQTLENKTEMEKIETKSVPKYFDLIIPKIGVETKVFPNINPSNEKEYQEVLKKGVAHAQGTYLPGENGTIYLFGHSTNSQANVERYNAVFYLLKNLKTDDEIKLVYQGKTYIYKVAEKKVVKPDELSAIKPEHGEEKLILQTCWPPGTTWQRLLVIAYPIT